MKKIISGLMFGIALIIGSQTFANDCRILTDTSMQNYEQSKFPLVYSKEPLIEKKIIPEELIQRALLNLQAHCCAAGLGDSKSCEEDKVLRNGRSNYPQSGFLFDHLIDVLMRRRTNDASYPNFPVDPEGKQRYEKVKKLILQADGLLPTTFLADYQKYWSIQPEYKLTTLSEKEKFNLLNTEKEAEKIAAF